MWEKRFTWNIPKNTQPTTIQKSYSEAYSATGKIHLRQQAENQKEHVICLAFPYSQKVVMHVNALRRWTAFPSSWIRFKTNVSRETPPPRQRQEKQFSKTIPSNLTTPPYVSRETHWHPWDVIKQKQCSTWNSQTVMKPVPLGQLWRKRDPTSTYIQIRFLNSNMPHIEAYSATGKIHLRQQEENQKENAI